MLLLLLLALQAEAAETLVAWTPLRVTLGNANVMTLFTIPADCRYIQFKFETNAGYLTTTQASGCTDGGTKDATDYFGVAADQWVELRVPGSGSGTSKVRSSASVCLSAGTNATVVNVMCTSDFD